MRNQANGRLSLSLALASALLALTASQSSQAAAWITTLTGLLRGSSTSMNTDLARLAKEIREVQPDYFVNVPALLERVRQLLVVDP